MKDLIKKLQNMVNGCKNIVFFGGAGVSTESGVPDFRSQDGLYNQQWDYPPETILSATFFNGNPSEFYRFYRAKILIEGIKPNAAHWKLAEMEHKGKLSAVITQNIDGLHTEAGSRNVFELHGTVMKNHCVLCGKEFDLNYVVNNSGEDYICHCDNCGGVVKPDVVLYEESLDDQVVNGAIKAISKADLLIIGGTSLTVYPAAGFIRYFAGEHLVMINKSETVADQNADLVIHDSIGKVMEQIIV